MAITEKTHRHQAGVLGLPIVVERSQNASDQPFIAEYRFGHLIVKIAAQRRNCYPDFRKVTTDETTADRNPRV